jgi:monovalent cation:H+ antiporter-2, CPA2 family
MDSVQFIQNFLVVLLAGTVAAVVCKKLRSSPLAGYLLVGAVIGPGILGFVADPGHELELMAEIGALLLLFSVGIEFSIDELARLKRFFLVGGFSQMCLVGAPLAGAAHLAGFSWPAAVLAGSAGAFSSTVLVFRALSETEQTGTEHGRRAIAVLLFQDVALVPLLMMVPMLTGENAMPGLSDYLLLAAKAVFFLSAVVLLHRLFEGWGALWLANLRSVEIVVLATVTLLCALGWIAWLLDMPPAIGAFAAGLVLSNNLLTKRIDAIILPFRETFAAIFFVTLGMLLQPAALIREPVLLFAGVAGIILLKTMGAAVALRLAGLSWPSSFGMGLGLSQLGEFSFLLLSRGSAAGMIPPEDYNRMLFIAIATLIATPMLLRLGLRWTSGEGNRPGHLKPAANTSDSKRAIVIGIGPIGGQIAARLETKGVDVTLVDLSPVNLHAFIQAGFSTIAGDARTPEVLARAGISSCGLVVVCVPKDQITLEIVRAVNGANSRVPVVVRCRFELFGSRLLRAGATAVVSEEAEAAGPLLSHCERLIERAN